MDVTVDEIKLKGEESSEMKRLQIQLALEIDKYKAQLRIFIHDRGLTTLSADNECFSVDLSIQTMKLKIAFEECDYFHNLSVIRSWRKDDRLFEIFAAYQWRRRGDHNDFTDIAVVKQGEKVDLAKFNYKKFEELDTAFRAVKGFMKSAKDLASKEIYGVENPAFYFGRDDFDILLGLKKPHVFYFLDVVQHIDKVNGNSTNLPPRTYLPNAQAVKSSWADPDSSRPGLYQWIEQIWGFECVSETAFVDNNEPVIYRQLQDEGTSGIRSRKNVCSDCAIYKEKQSSMETAVFYLSSALAIVVAIVVANAVTGVGFATF
jgi:hypothetical protein